MGTSKLAIEYSSNMPAQTTIAIEKNSCRGQKACMLLSKMRQAVADGITLPCYADCQENIVSILKKSPDIGLHYN